MVRDRPVSVLLARPDDDAASGAWVYRGVELPPLGDTIEVEHVMSGQRVLARVTHVWPESDYAIGATVSQPWQIE